MALSDGLGSVTQVAQALALEKARRANALENDKANAARLSSPKSFKDENGNHWRYVVVDGCEVQIEKCEPATQTLIIPSDIESKPVTALASDSFANLSKVESITLPPAVNSVGDCAFRECETLEKVFLSDALETFNPDWFRHCRNLHTLSLSGALPKITAQIFELAALRRLIVGKHTKDVMPGAFLNSQLEQIEVHPENEHLQTEGLGLYSKSNNPKFIALAVPCESYKVASNTLEIDKKAFSCYSQLQTVELPSCVQVISDYAFTKTGIREFKAPDSLKHISERAFFDCANLRKVTLNEGLETIGANAFSDTSLESLFIPKTVCRIGHPLADNTHLQFFGDERNLHIDQQSSHLYIDNYGALYKPAPEKVLLKMLNPEITHYSIEADTCQIAPEAFLKHSHIKTIEMPDTVYQIGAKAFRECHSLNQISLSSNLEIIEDEVFLDTNIESIHIPASVKRIGALALVTEGAHKNTKEPALKEIIVDPANTRYAMCESMLIESFDSGLRRVIVCTGAQETVVVPSEVTAIASYAFSGLRNIKDFTLSTAIVTVDVRGLALDCLPEVFHINLKEPVEGRTTFDIRFPQTVRSFQQMRLALGLQPSVDIEALLDNYDNSIVNASGTNNSIEAGLDAYEQARHILARLKDPIFMSKPNLYLARSVLENRLNEYTLDIARHDDKALLQDMLDLDIITQNNIDEVIDSTATIKDATITNFLLDAKRKMSGSDTIDFDAMFEL